MARISSVMVALLLSVGCASLPARGQPRPLERVAWLAGCWVMTGDQTVVHEQWLAPLGGSMLGVNRSVTNDRTTGWEFLRIVETDGELVYVARPSGRPEASFVQVELSDSTVVFANAKHDFPQRIGYQRRADGSLLARVTGVGDAGEHVLEFPMVRIPCEAATQPQ